MTFLLQITGLTLMFALVLILIVILSGIAAIKTAVDTAVMWIEGKRHDRKD